MKILCTNVNLLTFNFKKSQFFNPFDLYLVNLYNLCKKTPMLEARNIEKSYPNLHVLKGIDLSIKKGEIVSIVGASGAGKSTLLQILGTLDRADNGHIELNNVKIESRPKLELLPITWERRGFGYMIDCALIAAAAVPLRIFLTEQAVNTPWIIESDFLTYIVYFLILTITPISYYLIFEGFFSRTVGKMLTGTKVVCKSDGSKPDFKTVFYRTLARYIPFEWFSFLSKKPEGWHDAISNTVVADRSFKYLAPAREVLSDNELSEFRNKNIGFIFQFHNLLPEFTALENVCMPGYLGDRSDAAVIQKGKELLAMLGLTERIDHKPSQLSGGEQQRVAIARALINDPTIIFADEPSGNLDSHNAEELHKLFFKLREELNQTFVIVTHNESLANMADRKLEMRDGKIIV
jgi:ABC-type lipoprotein export system ATPase subunit